MSRRNHPSTPFPSPPQEISSLLLASGAFVLPRPLRWLRQSSWAHSRYQALLIRLVNLLLGPFRRRLVGSAGAPPRVEELRYGAVRRAAGGLERLSAGLTPPGAPGGPATGAAASGGAAQTTGGDGGAGGVARGTELARVLVVILRHDYGKPEQGDSYEYNYFYRTLERMVPDCRLFDFGPYRNGKEGLHDDLLRTAEEFSPDLIFFTLFEDEFSLETLDALKARFRTINWFCDDQWRYEKFSQRYSHHFTHVVTTDGYAPAKYRRAGYDGAILSQWATGDLLAGFPEGPIEYRHDVSFVGGANANRRWIVDELGRRGVRVACFGGGWGTRRVSYEEMKEVILASRINLNISNSRNSDIRYALSSIQSFHDFQASPKTHEQIKGRHFEINGFGGFQLTNYVDFLEDYLEIGREVAVYRGADDLIDKVGYYLENEPRRQEIARAGHERVRAEHTYEKRFEEIFRAIGVSTARGAAAEPR